MLLPYGEEGQGPQKRPAEKINLYRAFAFF